MTKVQAATLPHIMENKDVLAKAKTGTGKTVAFVLPSIESLVSRISNGNGPHAMDISVLIISPTRELTVQIAKETEALLTYHPLLSVMPVYGGTNIRSEKTRLESKKASRLSVLVLDEADQLLEMGFRSSIEKIVGFLPKNRQTLLFSATMPQAVQQVAGLALKPDYTFVDTVHEKEDATHAHVDQTFTTVSMSDSWAVLYTTLKDAISQKDAKIIIFSTTARQTQHMAAYLGQVFKGAIDVLEIHSRKSQSARDKASKAFRHASSAILCTSDVSARGVDYPNVTLVVQVGMPSSKEQYVHRLGRTARAGKKGQGHLLLYEFEERLMRRDLKELPLQKVEAPLVEQQDSQAALAALGQIDRHVSAMAYQTWLGYYNSCKGAFRSKTELVEHANMFAKTMGLGDTPPALLPRTIGKMGLKGVPGLHIDKGGGPPPPHQGQRSRSQATRHEGKGPAKRRHSASRGLTTLRDLPPGIARGIGDKLSTRRKEAALDVERMVKNSVSAGQSNDDILALVDELVETYVHPQSTVHQRKGGLLCLAAVTVGLAGGKSSLCQSENLLAKVLPPMLGAAVDSDGGIRYYALEALYNVAKSTKPAILNHLSELIDILLVLCDDVEVKNQNATIFVSDLIKDIVGEHQQHAFDVAAVLERLVGYLRAETPNKRRFLLGWFSFFDSMSSANKYFASIVPDLVPALLIYRADSVPEVHHAAENLLKHILGDIQDGSVRVSVRDLLESLSDSILVSGGEDTEDVAFHQSTQQIMDPRGFASCRSATLEWIEINVSECTSGAFHLALMDVVVQRIASSEEMAKLESLKWTALLMRTDAVSVCQIKPLLLHCLCDALSSTSDTVVEEAVVVLSVLSSIDSQGLDLTMKTIIQVFDGPGGAALLQRRGGIIVEKLCDLIPSENVIMPLVNQIKELKDNRLRRMLIQVINVLLLTSEKTKGCRALLQSKESDDFLRNIYQDSHRAYQHLICDSSQQTL
eukprot:jgi/Picre1/32654/NNA_008000.t1